ncbi:MAG: hypothetical protein HYR96_08730 [Deltaproteobacteria bacterium]|nr:hypothetical protein [Deltaproteobacteria bacterium]MBI3296180.1 hypothetical protein [Deltaproteobacteria bacterium]
MRSIGLILVLAIMGCGRTEIQFNPTSAENPNTTVNQQGPTSNCPSTFSSGNGSSLSPYAINNKCDFELLSTSATDLSKYFSLTQDVDVAGVTPHTGGDFTGHFEGNNHTLNHLTSAYSMFEFNSGTIQNLSVTNAVISRPIGTSGGRAGVIVGTNNTTGQIINCQASGEIDNGYYFIGGLVGLNSGTITHSLANVAVNGVAGIGGLVGVNAGTISQSLSLGKATASASGAMASNSGSGGLTGSNTGTIQDSFALGAAVGTDQVGGLIGYNSGVVINVFSAGAVTGGTNVGGLIGSVSGGSVTNGFWDLSTSLQASSAAGSGQSTANMQLQATFTGYDFSTVWYPPASGYPSLR